MPKLNWDGDDFRIPQDSTGTVADKISRNGSLQQGYFHGSLKEGLLAYYAMDEGSGNTVFDSTALSSDGTINGASWSSNSKIGDFCLNFDGTDDYADAGEIAYGEKLTICGWARPGSVTGSDDHSTVYSNNDNNAGDGFAVTAYEQGNWYFYHGSDFVEGPSVSTGVWTHLMLVISEGEFFEAYVDGQQVGRIDVSGNGNTIDTAYNTWIGSVPNGGNSQSNPFNGHIDDVRIYGRKLSEPEIQALYNSSAPSKVSPGDTLN
ncbi:LamG domain-containing protein [Candidatus Nanosalina sp. VS9-1]|uniref:LamG domain-containing protein n=1 Tax=Candidatus Nanosalina sp. VS9-1 TaxID=3388566 RepID=UPI0039E1C6DB